MENLQLAFRKAKKRKSKKAYVQEFESDLDNNLSELKNELETCVYEPKPLKTFVIRDPKTRVISASHFRDRIVHHAVCNILEPIFEKTFIFDSYANRKGKGTHAAIKRFDYFKRKVSQNGRLVKNPNDKNMVVGYYLKSDIKHYFDSVDHEVLIGIVKKKISDERVLLLIKKILDNYNSKIIGKGMPVGNLTSQFFANVYLDELDYFVKHKLKAKYYIRYVDDFVVLHRNKDVLADWKDKINNFLKTIKLELHEDKSKIHPFCKGVNFLGFRIFYHYKLPRKRNIRHFMKRLQKFIDLYNKGEIKYDDIIKSTNGWLAYAEWTNTYKMRNRIKAKIKDLFV